VFPVKLLLIFAKHIHNKLGGMVAILGWIWSKQWL